MKKELSENHSGWMVKEVMNLIYKRTGVKHHEVHITDYYTNGVSVLKYRE
jgi:hypothetical protein